MAESPSTRATLLLRLRDPRDDQAWAQFVAIYAPLVFGFVPIGLFYQACFSVAAAFLMWLLVKFAWPEHLEREIEKQKTEEDIAH